MCSWVRVSEGKDVHLNVKKIREANLKVLDIAEIVLAQGSIGNEVLLEIVGRPNYVLPVLVHEKGNCYTF